MGERLRKEVMRSDRKTLGRDDMRLEGEDADPAGDNPRYDPSGNCYFDLATPFFGTEFDLDYENLEPRAKGECAIRVGSAGSHDLFERGCLGAVEGRLGGVY